MPKGIPKNGINKGWFKKGQPLSEEIKQKLKGRIPSEETRKKLSEAGKGRIISEETRIKIGKANAISQLGHKHTEETKRKMSETKKRLGIKPPNRKGIPLTEEHKQKISKANTNNPKMIKALTGRICSPETRKKISEAQSGDKSPHWKGGIAYQPYPKDWNETLRDSIRQRDNYMCLVCGVSQDELIGHFKRLDVHHIDYNKDNLDPNNLITLCKSCHSKTTNNRDYWINYFK